MFELRFITALQLRGFCHTVDTDGEGNTGNGSFSTAIGLIHKHKPDVALELHMIAHENCKATGVETIALPKDKALAQAIAHSVAQVLRLTLRGT